MMRERGGGGSKGWAFSQNENNISTQLIWETHIAYLVFYDSKNVVGMWSTCSLVDSLDIVAKLNKYIEKQIN